MSGALEHGCCALCLCQFAPQLGVLCVRRLKALHHPVQALLQPLALFELWHGGAQTLEVLGQNADVAVPGDGFGARLDQPGLQVLSLRRILRHGAGNALLHLAQFAHKHTVLCR